MAQHITSDNFEALCNTGKPLVLDFWATWCGPCRRMAPVIEELAEEYDGRAIIGKCDIEEDEKLPMRYSVRNIPTILFIKDGEVFHQIYRGDCNDEQLYQKISDTLTLLQAGGARQ